MRILTLPLAVVVVVATLTGCGPGPRSTAGQERVDAAVAAAGMQDLLDADYSCTGSLPGREDSCSLRIDMVTDDLAVVEQAAAIDFSDSYTSRVTYKGVVYEDGLDGIDQIRAFEPYVTDEMRGARVTLSDEHGVRIRLSGTASFAHICDLAEDLTADWPFASVSTASVGETSAYWQVEKLPAEKPALFDETCALMDDYVTSVDDLTGFGYAKYQVDRDRVLISPDTRFDEQADRQREYAEQWFDDHPVPAALALDLY